MDVLQEAQQQSTPTLHQGHKLFLRNQAGTTCPDAVSYTGLPRPNRFVHCLPLISSGFSKDEPSLFRRRAVELKHGRVSRIDQTETTGGRCPTNEHTAERSADADRESPRRRSSAVIARWRRWRAAVRFPTNTRAPTAALTYSPRLPSPPCCASCLSRAAPNGCGLAAKQSQQQQHPHFARVSAQAGGDDRHHGYLGAVLRAFPRLSAVSRVRPSAPSGGAERALVIRAEQRAALLAGRRGDRAYHREAGVCVPVRVPGGGGSSSRLSASRRGWSTAWHQRTTCGSWAAFVLYVLCVRVDSEQGRYLRHGAPWELPLVGLFFLVNTERRLGCGCVFF